MKKWLYYFLLIIVQACSVNKTIIQVNNPSQTFTGLLRFMILLLNSIGKKEKQWLLMQF
jgi:hypothetical protein